MSLEKRELELSVRELLLKYKISSDFKDVLLHKVETVEEAEEQIRLILKLIDVEVEERKRNKGGFKFL